MRGRQIFQITTLSFFPQTSNLLVVWQKGLNRFPLFQPILFPKWHHCMPFQVFSRAMVTSNRIVAEKPSLKHFFKLLLLREPFNFNVNVTSSLSNI